MIPLRLIRALADDYASPTMVSALAELIVGRVAFRIVELEDGKAALLLRGTDQWQDWLRFNVLFRPDFNAGSSGALWHAGFYRYASAGYCFAKGWLCAGRQLDYIAGHSLGAAAAQIIGASLGIETHAFASPRPLWSRTQPSGAEFVSNWVVSDDMVCVLPPFIRHWVGKVTWLDHADRLWPGPAHAATRYCSLIESFTSH